MSTSGQDAKLFARVRPISLHLSVNHFHPSSTAESRICSAATHDPLKRSAPLFSACIYRLRYQPYLRIPQFCLS